MSSIPPPPPSGGLPGSMPPVGLPPTAPLPMSSTPIPPPSGSSPAGPIKPGRVWVVLGVLAMLGGVISFALIAGLGFIDAMKKVTTCDDCTISEPGTYELDPSSPGVFFLYMEGYGDAAAAKSAYRALDVELVDANGDTVELERFGNDFEMSYDGVDLVAVAEFEAGGDGPYTLTVSDPDGEGVAMRFGSISISDIARPVLLGAAIGGGVFLLGLITLIVTLVKRSKARKRRSIAQGPPPGMSPWGGAPPQAQPTNPPMPWGTPPPPPPGQWNPPQ